MQGLSNGLRYGVIVDCGSSGSRAHIFKWKRNLISKRIELVRDNSRGKHITPGLSSLKDEPHKASDYLEPIMDFISEAIPEEHRVRTPIHFMATAGLRLLDDKTRQAILNDIDRDLRGRYGFSNVNSQVISGEKEGIYSWVSLNMNRGLRDGQYVRTYGMIEMGGASTQVAFELDPGLERSVLNDLKKNEERAAFKQEQLSLEVGPESSVRLFTATFLGLGVNSAREASIDLLVKDNIPEVSKKIKDGYPEIKLQDPCLPLGAKETVLRPRALLTQTNQSIGFVIKQSEATFKVLSEGSGDFFECMNLLERVIKLAKQERLNCPLENKPCAMDLLGSNFIPYGRYPFVGLSEMFFTTNEMMNSAGLFNRSQVLHETKRICSSRYDNLFEMYAGRNETPDDRVLYECFKASWLLTILHDHGLNMPQDYDNFRTVEQIDGEEIDWTTGAMIMEVALKD